MSHLVALLLAVVIDRMIGDPRFIPHPVVGFGKLISITERLLNKENHRKAKGLFMVGALAIAVLTLTIFLVQMAYQIHLYVGILLEAWLISTTIASKGLKQAADEVAVPLKKGEFDEARKKLSYIVGRDTDSLNEEEITRATVETVAENTSDGVTAPLFFALIGGAPLAMLYRFVNTCDSMVGYKNERYSDFGWASAKCDDLLNWVPSRVTGFIMVFCTKPKLNRSKSECWAIVKRDARKHPSPNSGWGEAAVAALLGIQLGGINTYQGVVSNRAKMGDDLVTLRSLHIEETNLIMLRTTYVFTLMLLLGGSIFYVFT
ncbi:adenosylcobinamide-phosphate synthase CbiB [Halalkalibacter alkalisediminis]|uniref:Cobalamin biosynthesis protein CobD n=1 Tax=Halalkalibacter alkalisediminis TaxID=935616 RepID=A0ABV6NGC6_9BACI|nr:adenosylcobinamide-phosphate synthase CbiB [Halalkalibacter alkalisediminis]